MFGTSDDNPEEPIDAQRPTLPVLIDDARVTGLAVNLLTPAKPARQLKLNLSQSIAGESLDLTVDGHLNDTPLDLAVQAIPLAHLVNFGATRVSVDGHLGDIAIAGSVAVKDLLQPRRPELDISLKGPSIEYLTDRLGMAPLSVGPLDMTAAVHPDGEQMAFSLHGQFGEFMAALSGAFDDLRTLEQGAITLALSGPSVARVGALMGQENLPDLPFSIAGQATRSGKRLAFEESRLIIGGSKLDAQGVIEDLAFPTHADVSTVLNVPDLAALAGPLGLPAQLGGAVAANIDIKAGEDSASINGDISSDYGNFNVAGQLMRNESLSGSTLKLSGHDDDIEPLLALLPAQDHDAQAVEQALEQTLKGPWQLATELSISASHYQIQHGQFSLGDDRLGFNVDLHRSGPADDIQFAVDGELSSLRKYLKHFVDDQTLSLVPPGPLNLNTRGTLKGDQLALADTQFSLAGLQGQLQANTHLNSGNTSTSFQLSSDQPAQWLPAALLPKELNTRALQLPFIAKGDLQYTEGTLTLTAERLALGDSHLKGQFGLTPGGDDLSVRLAFSSPNIFVFASDDMAPADTTLPVTAAIDVTVHPGRLDVDQLEVRANDGTVLATKGNLRFGDTFDGTDLDLDINIASLNRLGLLLGQELPDAPLSVKADLSGDPRRIAAKDFMITSGESRASGTLRIFNPDHPNFQLNLRSDLLDLRPFLPEPATHTEAMAEPDTTAPAADGRLIPDTPLDLSPLQRFDAIVDIDIKRVVGHARRLKDVMVDAEVKEGQLLIKNAALTDEEAGAIRLSGFARPEKDNSRISLKLEGDDINIGFPATTPAEVAQLPRLDIQALLFGDAKTLRDLLTQGSGFVQVAGGAGKAPTMSGGLFTNDVLDELFSLLNPFRKEEPYTAIQCSALVASLENGQVMGSPLFTMVTDRLAIVSEAKIDLRTEKLFASFNTVPQKGLGLSATTALNPFVGVGGTLAKPQLTMDPTGTLVEGGLAFVTGGLSIVGKGLFDRLTTGSDACEKALKGAAKSREKMAELHANFR